MKHRNVTKPEGSAANSFLSGADGRGAVVQSFRRRLHDLTTSLGGHESLSYQEASLARRAVAIEGVIERMEHGIVEGIYPPVNEYTGLINCLNGLYKALGLKRRAKEVTLNDYLESAGGGE